MSLTTDPIPATTGVGPVADRAGGTPPADGPPAALVLPADRTEVALGELLAAERARWAPVDPVLTEPIDALTAAVLQGGKRLRPAFCTWGFVAAGGDPEAGDGMVTAAGCALELLHAFALVHDDVMDGADTRRGHPTVHVEFGARHGRAGWRGERRRFAEGVAVLVGDLAHSLAERAMQPLPEPVRNQWVAMQVELMLGQYLDVRSGAAADVDGERARRIARMKSGRYTIEHPLQIGARLAGAGDDDPVAVALGAYGAPLGVAFQLRDDLLGAFGDPARTGKPVGDDLREGKATPLLAAARSRASGPQLAVLDRVGAPDLTEVEVGRVQEVLLATGAGADIEAEIHRLVDEALESLCDWAPLLRPEGGEALADLARFVAGRVA